MPDIILKTTGAVGIILAIAVFSAERLSSRAGLGVATAKGEAPTTVEVVRPQLEPLESGFATVTLKADQRGHFMAEPAINGTRIALLVDTGASVVALSHEDASRVGIRPLPSDFTARISTANGMALGAPVTIREIRLGNISVENVQAMVMQRGRLAGSLLGMSFLTRLSSFQVQGNRLVLKR